MTPLPKCEIEARQSWIRQIDKRVSHLYFDDSVWSLCERAMRPIPEFVGEDDPGKENKCRHCARLKKCIEAMGITLALPGKGS